MRKLIATLIILSWGQASYILAQTVDFEDLSLPEESFYNGSDGAAGFTSGGVFFPNQFDMSFGSWSGFAYSNRTDNTTAGFLNQYGSFAGGGFGGQGNFAVGYVTDPAFGIAVDAAFATPVWPTTLQVTNTTYTALSIRDGDAFAKKFGGPSGDDPDYLRLIITGINTAGIPTGSVDFYLADYRFEDQASDYIIDEWETVDLTRLGQVSSLRFDIETTDVGMFGPNTPLFFAADQLVFRTVPEPSYLAGLAGLSLVLTFYWRRLWGPR